MAVEEIMAMTTALNSVLWTFAWLVLFGIFVWAIYTVFQVANDAKGYYRDLIGFQRGKVRKAAEKANIEIVIEPEKQKKEKLSEIDKILRESKEKPKK